MKPNLQKTLDLLSNSIAPDAGLKIIGDWNMVERVRRLKRKSFFERWLCLPWEPWEPFKVVWCTEPATTALRFGNILVMHPAMIKQVMGNLEKGAEVMNCDRGKTNTCDWDRYSV